MSYRSSIDVISNVQTTLTQIQSKEELESAPDNVDRHVVVGLHNNDIAEENRQEQLSIITSNNNNTLTPIPIISSINPPNISTIQASIQWRKDRLKAYNSWFVTQDGKGKLKPNADEQAEGPILDFIIAGFAKCGTTTLMANLGKLAPMPISDVCTPIHQTVYYAYNNWVRENPPLVENHDYPPKDYRGSKCPAQIVDLKSISKYVPKTKVILGIRHPLLWFKSFWNMQASNAVGHYQRMTPYNLTKACFFRNDCRNACPPHVLFCMHRGRFHIQLAQIGKTPLSSEERKLLAPMDKDGGDKIKSQNIKNLIFLYEQSELSQDYVWEELGYFLHYPNGSLPHSEYKAAHGRLRSRSNVNLLDICLPENDKFRSMMMPYAHEMSIWICEYFVKSPDVFVPGGNDKFCSIVKEYTKDPCDRLIREGNGKYVLRDELRTTSTVSKSENSDDDDNVVVDVNADDLESGDELYEDDTDSIGFNTKFNYIGDSNMGIDIDAKWRHDRLEKYPTFFENGQGTGNLLKDADKDGPILDFIIAGFAKCGTSTMMANLAKIAPMPMNDICTPIHQTVYYSYINWAKEYDNDPHQMKLYRGSKCPATIYGLGEFSTYLPKTKVIIGIRHPILWFQSFWNQQANNFPDDYVKITPMDKIETCEYGSKRSCSNMCKNELFCLHRGRFHLSLAQLGKTPLSDEERMLLAPNDFDGGDKVKNNQIRNPIFLYEQTELSQDYVWKELGQYLNYPNGSLSHDLYQGAKRAKRAGKGFFRLDICEKEHDEFRSLMMPYAYEMQKWICEYFVESPDVHVAGGNDQFCSIVREYENDPCNRLERDIDGTYVLKEELRNA